MGSSAPRLLRVTALNATPAAYAPILRLQELLFEMRRRDEIPDTLLQLEVRRPVRCRRRRRRSCHYRCLRHDRSPSSLRLQHSSVYTIGKRGSVADFRTAADALAARGAEIVTIPRGGETTYHGPGQLVVYPIVSLRGLGVGARAYVEGLEDVLVRTLGRYGIAARVSNRCGPSVQRMVAVSGCEELNCLGRGRPHLSAWLCNTARS